MKWLYIVTICLLVSWLIGQLLEGRDQVFHLYHEVKLQHSTDTWHTTVLGKGRLHQTKRQGKKNSVLTVRVRSLADRSLRVWQKCIQFMQLGGWGWTSSRTDQRWWGYNMQWAPGKVNYCITQPWSVKKAPLFSLASGLRLVVTWNLNAGM